MSLEAWKADHGTYPDNLEQLLADYLEVIPVDDGGRPFERVTEGFLNRWKPAADSSGDVVLESSSL